MTYQKGRIAIHVTDDGVNPSAGSVRFQGGHINRQGFDIQVAEAREKRRPPGMVVPHAVNQDRFQTGLHCRAWMC